MLDFSTGSSFLLRSLSKKEKPDFCEKSASTICSGRSTNSERLLRPLQRLRLLRQYQRHHLRLPALLVRLWARQWHLKCRLRHLVLLLQFRQAMWARF